jgi:hypothetical protein
MTGDETRRRPGAALDQLRHYVSAVLADETTDQHAALERAETELGIICAGLPAGAVVLSAAEEATLREAIAEAVAVMQAHARACRPPSGSVLLSAAEAETAWQALADAAAWRAGRADDGNGCFGCVRAQARARAEHAPDPDLARCPEHARYDTIVADYAALRIRLGGDRR